MNAWIIILSVFFVASYLVLIYLGRSEGCGWLRCYRWACNGCKKRRPCEYCYFYRLIRQKCMRCENKCPDLWRQVYMR